MDIARILDHLVPAARYGGSLTANTRDAYEALRWEDARSKPTWAEIEAAWETLPPPGQKLKPLAFIDRFAAEEQAAIVTAAQANAGLNLWLVKLGAAEYVDTADPLTIAGVQALVDAGLISAERRDAVLGG